MKSLSYCNNLLNINYILEKLIHPFSIIPYF
jgi:hypothetical protein